METIQLETHKRPAAKAKHTRNKGYIPAVIYGPGMNGKSSSITVEYQAFRKVYRTAGESTVIELDVEGKTIPTLVYSLEFHPVSGEFEHIDFYAMDMEQAVQTHIPIVFTGTAPAVKEKDAILVISKESLEVKCLPKYLVHDLTVDVSGLEDYHDHVSVKDISVPEGITVLDDPEDFVINATAPKIEQEEEQEEELAEGEEVPEGEEGEETEKGEISEEGEEKGAKKEKKK